MTYKTGTVAAVIERFIDAMASPKMKPIGPSEMYTLRLLQRSPIGAKPAASLTRKDIIEHCQMRQNTPGRHRPNGVSPATVNQDVTYLGVALNYAGAAFDDCDGVSAAAITAARPFLVKNGLIGKSTPRKRRPTDEEIERLLAYFETPLGHGKPREIRMVDLIAFALVSTRRIGEICRMTHGDIDWQKRTYWVRDLKHPTKKKGNDKEFALFDELAEIIRRQPRRTNLPGERVFPFNAKSAGASYTTAKKRLGIQDLRFHDNRREAISRWLKKLTPHKVRQISGHETTIVLERVYDAPKAEDLHDDIAALTKNAQPVERHAA